MSKYEEMRIGDLEANVVQSLNPDMTEHEIDSYLYQQSPSVDWEDCYPVMDELMKLTGGVYLKEDGSATTEINGKECSVAGGHCRAICILYLMAKDAEKELQKP